MNPERTEQMFINEAKQEQATALLPAMIERGSEIEPFGNTRGNYIVITEGLPDEEQYALLFEVPVPETVRNDFAERFGDKRPYAVADKASKSPLD